MGKGSYANGSIFRINADGTGYAALKNFPPTTDNGSRASTNADGAVPLAGVILAGGTLYGTASGGGLEGMGTVFSLKTSGADFTVLKHFSGPDGKAPYGELLLVGNILYGTTAAGGDFGKGTIFQINTDGSSFRILKSFAGTDGMLPLSGLTFSDGALYGTTLSGGAGTNGTVFSIHPDGTDFLTLKEFNGQDGAGPRYNLAVTGGWIYGTTEGANAQSLVYRLRTDGSQYNILKTFSALDALTETNDDGNFVQSGLEAYGGTVFGSTRYGGCYGSGVLFALKMDGSRYTVLWHFTALTYNGVSSVNADGALPGPLTLSGSTIYGTPKAGGAAGAGSLFALNIAPQMNLNGAGAGLRPGGFGFKISGYSNQVVSVEGSTNLEPPSWQPLTTNTIGAGPVEFVDQNATNFPQRFYRLLSQ